MEILHTFFQAELVVPIPQIVFLLTMSSIFILLRRIKLALLTNYIFALYWGWIFTRDYLLSLAEDSAFYLFAYFGVGAAILVVALIGFMFSEE